MKRIVDDADPAEPLELDAPADEYKNYSADALRRLLDGANPSDTAGYSSPWSGARSSTWFVQELQLVQAELRGDQGDDRPMLGLVGQPRSTATLRRSEMPGTSGG